MACQARVAVIALGLTLGAVPSAAEPLCGTRATPPPTYAHVVWIWFENQSYGDIVGSRAAPYINRTLIPGCGLATNYHNVSHPSLPNYIAATSGLSLSRLGPLRNDCNATGPCHTKAPSIFSLVPSWRAYAQSMRRPCLHFFNGSYAASHNPPVYYDRLRSQCPTSDVPFADLQADLGANTLPSFAFITPDLCNSMHSCSVETGDRWLAGVVGRLVASEAYQSGTTAIFVTFDEGEPEGSDNCATNTSDAGCHVATFVISPTTRPGTRSGVLFNHYSLLRTTEEMLGVGPLLGRARHAHSMRAAFDL
jgi:phosphatidylinositol-3-phosphatase